MIGWSGLARRAKGAAIVAMAGSCIEILVAAAGMRAADARERDTSARRVVVERYPDGHVMRRAEYLGAALDGTIQGWYDDGAPEYERTYRDGLEEGAHRGWYESGRIKFEYHYAKGLSEGVQRQWYPSGAPFTVLHDRAGHEVGEQQMWNADGTVRSNYVIKDGRRFGLLGAVGCTGHGPPPAAALQ